jgi:hypothetical protein
LERAESIVSVTGYVLAHPRKVFIESWNWKAAILSGVFRAAAFVVPMARSAREEALGMLCIEIALRAAIGGCWGSLLQRFRNTRPAWLAGLWVTVVVPAGATWVEYAALKATHTAHLKFGVIVSAILNFGALGINFGLMRRGLLITGESGGSLGEDLRRIPGALAAMSRGIFQKATT